MLGLRYTVNADIPRAAEEMPTQTLVLLLFLCPLRVCGFGREVVAHAYKPSTQEAE